MSRVLAVAAVLMMVGCKHEDASAKPASAGALVSAPTVSADPAVPSTTVDAAAPSPPASPTPPSPPTVAPAREAAHKETIVVARYRDPASVPALMPQIMHVEGHNGGLVVCNGICHLLVEPKDAARVRSELRASKARGEIPDIQIVE